MEREYPKYAVDKARTAQATASPLERGFHSPFFDGFTSGIGAEDSTKEEGVAGLVAGAEVSDTTGGATGRGTGDLDGEAAALWDLPFPRMSRR